MTNRSVRVLWVAKSRGGSLRLPDIASQLLGKPDDALDVDDIEKLFDVMTVRDTGSNAAPIR